MNDYEKLLDKASTNKVKVVDYTFSSDRIKGLYCDKVIAINKKLKTTKEKSCILAEELGHYHTSTGNILDQSNVSNRKQEQAARLWAYNELIDLHSIINSYKSGCQNRYEIAEFLGVTEEFLMEALDTYRSKFGEMVRVNNYIIMFEPYFGVFEGL